MAEGTLVITLSNQSTTPPVFTGTFITGWHVPTRAEILTLVANAGGAAAAGDTLRAIGVVYWTTGTGTDDYGFACLGAGYRDYEGLFGGINTQAEIWTSTEFDEYDAYEIHFLDNDPSITDTHSDKKYGFSVRLIKDDSTNPGTVTDYDGNIYKTIKIGTQVWMAANLATTHYADGIPIPIVTDNAAWAALTTAGMCYYNNTP